MTVAVSNNLELTKAFEYCRQVTRKRARNFYYGLKLAPEPKRSALFALYAWMRKADDIVDQNNAMPSNNIRESLEKFRSNTQLALEGNLPDGQQPLWRALRHIAEAHDIDHTCFHDMLDGQLKDLEPVRYETFNELQNYCECVASSVGMLCIGIWGYEDPKAPKYAVDRGIAFQLTNILRDFSEDYDDGRVYLPVETFKKFSLSPVQLRHWNKPEECYQFMSKMIERTHSYYENSKPLDEVISRDCLPVLWAMTSIYSSLLAKIENAPQRAITGKRVRLSSFRKSLIAIEAKRMQKDSLEPVT